MNLSTEQPPLAVADELAPPLQPQRLSTSCNVHPDEQFSGFCPSCLCERLSVLDHTGAPLPPKKPPNNISAASLKALFKPSSSNNNNNNKTRPGFFPELRRSKSFSAKNNEGFSGGFEPQRRSCDVRLREEHRNVKTEEEAGKSSVSEAVFEEVETEEETEEAETEEIIEITEEKTNEIVEEEEEEEGDELKPMKDYIDLYPQQTKKPSIKTFFSAASVFTKKLQKWKQKQKVKKQRIETESREGKNLSHKKPSLDTQSEIADYGFGRRSSDTDPRFSLDAGRFSVDIGRISVDDSSEKPRASWDGSLLAKQTSKASKLPPPPSMLSVVENAPINIQTEEEEEEPLSPVISPIVIIPGGTNQTRDYYNDLPSRRRKSLDRSNSIRKIVGSEVEEVKTTSSSKVSPAVKDDYLMENKENHQNVGDKKSRRWGKWNVFGFINRKGVNREEEEEDRYSRSNSAGVVERSLSESWPEMSNGGGAKMRRSNSNVSWRSSGEGGGSVKNGMLKFYLTPLRSSRRKDGGGGGGWEKTAAKANSHGHSIAKRVMRLY